jgi:1-phosphofructokinase family hexose kinase
MAIYTLTLNPTLDIHMQFDKPTLGTLNRARAVRYAPSGKGYNVSCALYEQGLTSIAIMPLGGPIGYLMEHMLSQASIPTHIIKVQGETRANTKVIDPQGILTEWNGVGAKLSEAELEACLEPIRQLTDSDTLILSGSLSPGVSSSIYAQMITIAKSNHAQVILDASGEALELGLAAKPSMLKPNLLEARELLKTPIATYGEALQAAKTIHSQGIPIVILSLEDKGALFLRDSEVCLAIPPKITAITPSGAGDSMLAGTLYGLSQDWPWYKIAQHATATAAARVGSSSITFPNLAHINEQFDKVTLVKEEVIPFDMNL